MLSAADSWSRSPSPISDSSDDTWHPSVSSGLEYSPRASVPPLPSPHLFPTPVPSPSAYKSVPTFSMLQASWPVSLWQAPATLFASTPSHHLDADPVPRLFTPNSPSHLYKSFPVVAPVPSPVTVSLPQPVSTLPVPAATDAFTQDDEALPALLPPPTLSPPRRRRMPIRKPKEHKFKEFESDDTAWEDPESLVLIGRYTRKERRAKVAAYLQKRMQRSLAKKVIYGCRKMFADARPRIGGRFVKLSDLNNHSSI